MLYIYIYRYYNVFKPCVIVMHRSQRENINIHTKNRPKLRHFKLIYKLYFIFRCELLVSTRSIPVNYQNCKL